MPNRSDAGGASRRSSRRIGEVVQETGLSKELIHHYLRQELLPESPSRGRYSERQVRLLHQIRILREDHNLPLELIRSVFALFEFDPGRIESLTLSESLGRRMTAFADNRELLSSGSVSLETLIETARITVDRLREYVREGLVSSFLEGDEERFSAYDANIVALCERGVELGISFESFRTIASYIRVAFELEYPEFFRVRRQGKVEPDRLLSDLFLRREISHSFVQNVLNALMLRRLRQVLEQAPYQGAGLDEIVYRPSPAFLKRHDLERHIDDAQRRLSLEPEEPEGWHRAGSLLLHAGRSREAAFCLEESLRRWPFDKRLRGAYGRALLLLGDYEEGCRQLERAARGQPSAPLAWIYLALASFKQALAAGHPERFVQAAVPIFERVEAAIDAAKTAEAGVRTEVNLFGGWLLTVLPAMFHAYDRGRALLAATLEELDHEPLSEEPLPGLGERLRINAAFLLFDCLRREESGGGDVGPLASSGGRSQEPDAAEACSETSRERLRTLICRLDPGSAFAEVAYLDDDPSNHRLSKEPKA